MINQLTESMLKREVHCMARSMGMVDHLIIDKDVKTTVQQVTILSIEIDGDKRRIKLSEQDLLMSLDDFSHEIILPSMKSIQYGFKDAHIPAFL